MEAAKVLVEADYLNIVIGENVAENYNPEDVVALAETLTADILTVGGDADMLPDGKDTNEYVGRLDDNYDIIEAADSYLIVGVASTAENISWSVFRGDGIVVTNEYPKDYKKAIGWTPFNHYLDNADANTLEELSAKVSELASQVEPATVYSENPEHPNPPSELDTDLSAKVKQCKICHTLTNHTVTVGDSYPGSVTEWQCPGAAHRNHDRIIQLKEKKRKIERRKEHKEKRTDADKHAIKKLEKKNKQVTKQIEALRDWFDGRFDDVIKSDLDLPDSFSFRQFKPK